MLSEYFDTYAGNYRPYKGGRWCYEDGCLYRALELWHLETGEDRWLDHLLRLTDPQIDNDGNLLGYALSDYNIDNILPGRSLLYLNQVTGDARYLKGSDLLARQLASHPRTKSGAYWHKLRYPWQIWLDGLYMGQPFQVAYAHACGKTEMVSDSLRQLDTALNSLYDPRTGLYWHAYDEAREQPWADPVTGFNKAFWARAIGWLAMALVDVADLVGPDFSPLRARTTALLETILKLRVQDSIWLQVVDRPDLKGNYLETSGSAMFAYALLRGARLGLIKLPDGLADTVMKHALSATADGGHEMIDICEVAGLGWYEGRFRDGSPEYYLTEARVVDDIKGVSPLMMAAALMPH